MAYTDRFPIVKNFLETKLTADCDAGETALYLENVDGLPAIISGRDYVPLVLRDAGTVREIVYVDAVDNTAGTVTVRRGQEGTTPAAWATGTYAYCTVTSDSFQRMRVNGFSPLVTDEGRPSISRTSATTVSITGDFSAQLEVGMAVRILSGDTVVEPTDAELGAIHVTSVSFSAGVTSVSFQNVSLPTKVDGLDLGLSVAAAPLYHPDMIVADEDTLTQTQNVLSVSQKFKDDLKAEQALIDAAQDAAIADAKSSAEAASEDVTVLDTALRQLIAEELAKYLPLAGGTMTGHLHGNKNSGLIDFYTLALSSIAGAGHGGYIDFHFNGSTEGFTSRIIEYDHILNLIASNGVWVNGSPVLTAISMPDYSAGVTVSSGFTAPSAGLYRHAGVNVRGNTFANGLIVDSYSWQEGNFSGHAGCTLLLSKGDVITYTGTVPPNRTFFPLKGV